MKRRRFCFSRAGAQALESDPRRLKLDSTWQNEDHSQRMNLLNDQLSLAPLGAGDLIDRAVRMYRHHFFTLIRIAAPPVLVSAHARMCL